MFTADDDLFPNNIVLVLSDNLKLIDSEVPVLRRPLRATDPNQCMGITVADWNPEPDSEEIGGIEPTIQRYRMGLQAFIKDMDEERGLRTHTALARAQRVMLYRSPDVRVSLGQLRVEDADGRVERTLRWGMGTQRYLSNEIGGSFLYLTTLEFWLETETT